LSVFFLRCRNKGEEKRTLLPAQPRFAGYDSSSSSFSPFFSRVTRERLIFEIESHMRGSRKTLLIKIDQTHRSFSEHGDRVVIRQCSVPYHDEIDIVDGPCGSSMTQQEHDESCHICSTDLCNSATTASTMQLLYAGALALLVFYQFKYCVL